MKKTGRSSYACPENQIGTNNENLPHCSKCKQPSQNTIETALLAIKNETVVGTFLNDAIDNVK